MNSTEKAYAETLSDDPNVHQWWFEALGLRYSHPDEGRVAIYTPDFLVLMTDGLTYVDDVKASKGYDDNAAIARIKACAELYPLWKFRTIHRQSLKNGGGWLITEV